MDIEEHFGPLYDLIDKWREMAEKCDRMIKASGREEDIGGLSGAWVVYKTCAKELEEELKIVAETEL